MSELDLPQVRGQLLRGETLAPFTWFRVGGPADALFLPADEDDLAQFLAALSPHIPVLPIGVGSNLIVRDGGVPGVVVRLAGRQWAQVTTDFDTVDAPQARVVAGAGALDSMVAKAAAKAGIGGLEFLAGIPGTIGGALTMNAGCYGTETKDVLEAAWGFTRAGEKRTYGVDEFGFTYRHNAIEEPMIWVQAVFVGRRDDPVAVTARMAEITARREASQPIREKTGGSTFKNPVDANGEKLSAWKLNDEAGMRGARRGGAQVSELHANFLINTGDATAADIEGLGEDVRAAVKAKHGIELEWEIKRVGSWWPRAAPLGPTMVITGPREVPGDRKFIRWLASLFNQDSDIIYGTEEFGGVVAGVTQDFPPDDLQELLRELKQLIADVHASTDDEPTNVQRYWVKLGFDLLPDKPVVQALEQIQRAIEARIAAS